MVNRWVYAIECSLGKINVENQMYTAFKWLCIATEDSDLSYDMQYNVAKILVRGEFLQYEKEERLNEEADQARRSSR